MTASRSMRSWSIKGTRWVVEHNSGPDEATMDRIVKMGMILSLQRQMGPLLRQVDGGMIVTLGSDYPAGPNNPFLIMAQHITRRMKGKVRSKTPRRKSRARKR
jgi:predicted amidohydrolase YtcJ